MFQHHANASYKLAWCLTELDCVNIVFHTRSIVTAVTRHVIVSRFGLAYCSKQGPNSSAHPIYTPWWEGRPVMPPPTRPVLVRACVLVLSQVPQPNLQWSTSGTNSRMIRGPPIRHPEDAPYRTDSPRVVAKILVLLLHLQGCRYWQWSWAGCS